MRYIPVGGEAQFERLAISIKFVTVERKAISNAARNIPPPLCPRLKDKKLTQGRRFNTQLGIFYTN